MNYAHALTALELSRRSTAAKPTSDETLLSRVGKGDKDALRLLYARHNVRVFRFVLRMVGNDAVAEDLVSEIFIDVWNHAGRFEARSQVTTWILGIARHKALSHLRCRAVDQLDVDTLALMPDPADSPEEIAQRQDRSAILQDCIKQLSPQHREVIDLVYYHEQSLDQVARIVGVPENTVKTRVFYARKHIAEMMAARGIERSWL
jgi:RNA polymerase sigma-70 factor, ECF subfamily